MENANAVREIVQPTPPQEFTEEHLKEIIQPSLSKDSFKLGEKTFRIRVLPWQWEEMFRKNVMPLLAVEVKPLEQIIYFFSTELSLIKEDAKFTEAALGSELNADKYLTDAVMVICMSQDPTIQKAAQDGIEVPLDEQLALERKYRLMIRNAEMDESPREYFRNVVRLQMRKLKLVETLGESLMARLEEFAKMTGTASTFDSLKQVFTQQVSSYLDRLGQSASMLARSSSPSTETSSETSSRTPAKELEPEKESAATAG